MQRNLFLLNASTACPLSLLNTLLVSLDLPSTTHSHKASRSLPRSLQIPSSRLAEQMDLDQVSLKCALQRDDRLDEKRIGVLEVQMHNAHHSNTHELRLEHATKLLQIVGVNSGGDEFGLFGAAHWGWFDVFEGREVCKGAC